MSEKRFTWDGDILFDCLELRELGNCLEARDIADLLNELSEENEQLKQSNDRFADTVAKQVSLLIELRKENEQLRKQVAEYEMILRQHEFAEKEGFK